MIMTVEAKLIQIGTDGVYIGVGVNPNSVHKMLIPEFYIAMLKGMRDAHEDEFHKAMIAFIREGLGND